MALRSNRGCADAFIGPEPAHLEPASEVACMPLEPDTNIVVRPAQHTAPPRSASEVDCPPSEFDTSIVIRQPQHAAAVAIAAGEWSEAAIQLATCGDWATFGGVIESRAAKQVLDRYLDSALTEVIERQADPEVWAESP